MGPLDQLKAMWTDNQFLSGGLVLGAFTAFLMLCRQYLVKGLNWCWRQATVHVEVRNTDAPFDWLVLWLDQHPYTRRARRLTVSIGTARENKYGLVPSADSAVEERPSIMFSPAVGTHVFLYKGRLLWLTRDRDDPKKDSWRERESFNIMMIGRSQETARKLLEEAYDAYALTVRKRSRIFYTAYNEWIAQGFVRQRTLESVVLNEGVKTHLLADVQAFLASEAWYHSMGIPYRRGYLFHGTPGSGKSSLVAALAGHLGFHLYVVNLPSLVSDSSLVELLHQVSVPRAVILFEDIDVARAAQERGKEETEDKDKVSIAGLLNALDGVASRDGYITVLTTNRRTLLDPALTRPGRIDLELELGWASAHQAVALYERFYGHDQAQRHAPTLVAHFPDEMSMATLQEHFLRHRSDPQGGANLKRLRPAERTLRAG